MNKTKFTLLILLGLNSLSGCNQDQITLHQAHVYQDKTDHLKVDAQVLASRFKHVQTDR